MNGEVFAPYRRPTVWKQSRQYTGRAPVGTNGTWVGLPQFEQTTSCITRARPLPSAARRAARHSGQRRGSFWSPRDW